MKPPTWTDRAAYALIEEEDNLRCYFAESGADRELDFNPEDDDDVMRLEMLKEYIEKRAKREE